MRTLVTGATGLLGVNLVQALLQAGHEVTALVRSEARGLERVERDARLAVGDVCDPDSYTARLRGIDTVFHTAASVHSYYERPGRPGPELWTTNVTAVGVLFRAAAAAGVGTVVHTSSGGTLGPRPGGGRSDETAAPGPLTRSDHYLRSKLAAEQVAREAAGQLPVRVPMVLPGLVWGPGDFTPTSTGALLLDLATGRLPVLPAGGSDMVDARDVALAMISAAQDGVSGARYALAGPYQTLAEVAAVVARVTGVPAPRYRVSARVLLAAAPVAELAARMTGRPALVTRAGARILLDPMRMDAGRAQRELGAGFRPFEETIADELTWFRTTGRL